MRAPRRSRRVALGPTGQRDQDPLAGRPRLVDVVRLAITLQPFVDPVGHPQQGELAQCGQVADPEIVRQRGVHLVGRIHVAVREPASQRLRAHVDQLDLVGPAHDLVGHRLLLPDAGDRGDDVVERLEVLDVDRRDDIDAGVEQFVDVLPPLWVAAARDVGVRELVDQRDLRCPSKNRVDVHLSEPGVAVHEVLSRHDLQPLGHGRGARPAVRLEEADHNVGTAGPTTLPLAEHGERLAHARGGSEVDAQRPAAHSVIVPVVRAPG